MAIAKKAIRKVAKSKAVKEAVRGAKDVLKSASSAGKKVAKSKRVRAGVKALGHAALGTTGLAAIGSATKRNGITRSGDAIWRQGKGGS